MVTINGSIADFNADVGGIYTSFKNAIAAAAGVLPAQVVIIGVTQRPGGRRSSGDGADVQVKVLGSNRLGTIKHSIAVSAVWQPQHAVHVRRVLFSD